MKEYNESEINAIKKYQDDIMANLNVSDAARKLLQPLPPCHAREYLYMLAFNGMPADGIKRTKDAVTGQKADVQIAGIKREYSSFMKKLFTDNADLSKKIDQIHASASSVVEQNKEYQSLVIANFQATVKSLEASAANFKESYHLMMEEKNQQIRDKQAIIDDLTKKLEETEQEMETTIQKISKKNEELLRKLGEDDGSNRKKQEVNTKKKKGFFSRNKEEVAENEVDHFIKQYLTNSEFQEEQKDYLMKCLEDGDSLEDIKKWAIPSISVPMMERLRKVYKEKICDK
ncbi:MAG: hypothetical protein Q4E53_10360 [Eubacteriales bacterium]|nr:hypothetical protein [Eubacteriales bacterium]